MQILIYTLGQRNEILFMAYEFIVAYMIFIN